MANWKKKLKKAAKVAVPLLGALALAKGVGKRKLSKAVSGTDDAGIGVSHLGKWDPGVGGKQHIPTPKIPTPKKWRMPDDPGRHVYPNIAFKGGGIAKRGMGAAFKKGGHVKSMGIAKRGGGVAKR